MGLFDQYSKLIRDVILKDVVVAVGIGAIAPVDLTVAVLSLDLPWAGQIGNVYILT